MTDALAQAAAWLSSAANSLGRLLLAPVGVLPGWLSATAVATVTGILILAVFKYTSNQTAIKRVRADINAHLLALKLFKDSARVSLRAQGRILLGAGRLFVLAVVPMLVMALPVTLLLGQLSLWYQARPLRVGEEAVIALKLNGHSATAAWPSITLKPTDALEVEVGPVRIRSQRTVCWNVKARAVGSHRLEFHVGDKAVAKDFAVGDGFMRVSQQRPGWNWSDILLNPWEQPFPPDSSVHSIEISYPHRSSWTSGTDSWVIYWFLVSMVAALCFRRVMDVKL
jgi:hypothetical protein